MPLDGVPTFEEFLAQREEARREKAREKELKRRKLVYEKDREKILEYQRVYREANRIVLSDHCHLSGKFRGWLCRGCNSALGFVGDDPKTLKALIRYLKERD